MCAPPVIDAFFAVLMPADCQHAELKWTLADDADLGFALVAVLTEMNQESILRPKLSQVSLLVLFSLCSSLQSFEVESWIELVFVRLDGVR